MFITPQAQCSSHHKPNVHHTTNPMSITTQTQFPFRNGMRKLSRGVLLPREPLVGLSDVRYSPRKYAALTMLFHGSILALQCYQRQIFAAPVRSVRIGNVDASISRLRSVYQCPIFVFFGLFLALNLSLLGAV
jgi:hypothetical protein